MKKKIPDLHRILSHEFDSFEWGDAPHIREPRELNEVWVCMQKVDAHYGFAIMGLLDGKTCPTEYFDFDEDLEKAISVAESSPNPKVRELYLKEYKPYLDGWKSMLAKAKALNEELSKTPSKF